MTSQIVFKKISREDYPAYLQLSQAYEQCSFFRLKTAGEVTALDLEIMDKSTDTYLIKEGAIRGIITFSGINSVDRNACVSFFFNIDLEYWTSPINVFIQRYCANNSISKLQSMFLTDDEHARVILETFGFEKEGTLRRHFYHNGGYLDVEMYGRLVS